MYTIKINENEFNASTVFQEGDKRLTVYMSSEGKTLDEIINMFKDFTPTITIINNTSQEIESHYTGYNKIYSIKQNFDSETPDNTKIELTLLDTSLEDNVSSLEARIETAYQVLNNITQMLSSIEERLAKVGE